MLVWGFWSHHISDWVCSEAVPLRGSQELEEVRSGKAVGQGAMEATDFGL